MNARNGGKIRKELAGWFEEEEEEGITCINVVSELAWGLKGKKDPSNELSSVQATITQILI